MRAGFGIGEIVFPEEMFPVEGFCGIHDNPHVRIVFLQGKTDAMALCVMELVNVPETEISYGRERMAEVFQIPIEKTWVHMTHAITTPHEPGPMGPPEKRPPITERQKEQKHMFSEEVRHAFETALQKAKEDLSEAKIGWGRGKCLANQNRDVETPHGWWIGEHGDGPSDKEMILLRVEDQKGKCKGLLVNYGLKPCTIDNSGMDDGTRQISSDCCGMACTYAEKALDAVVIYTMGAAGDQIPVKTSLLEIVTDDGDIKKVDEGVQKGLEYAEDVSAILAYSILQIAGEITCSEAEIPMGWEYVAFDWQLQKKQQRKPGFHVTYTGEGKDGSYTAEVFRLGEAVLVANRTETMAQTGLELKEQSAAPYVLLLCMTNGEAKYMPDRLSTERGTWEAQSSKYMPGCAEKFVQETTKAIQRLWN